MKSSGIGGQAVIEGIMMLAPEKYSISVRNAKGEIITKTEDYVPKIKNKFLTKTPFVRGFFNMINSMVLGMKSLTYSADIYAEDMMREDDEQTENSSTKIENKNNEKEKEEKEGFFSTAFAVISIIFSLIFAIGLFVALPYFASLLFRKFIESKTILALIEGIIRIVIFVAYISAVSLMKDIKRVYMYHGAEHKCINCIENGLELNVENVRKSSKEHKRCGTSFLLFVVLVSIVVGMCIRVDTVWLRLVIRIALIPVVAGIAYEIIKLAGNSNNKIILGISKLGLLMQGLTTKEPTDEMIEVGIASVEAVFDWRAYQEEERKALNAKS